jgi:cell division septum initiation protein DivIVA
MNQILAQSDSKFCVKCRMVLSYDGYQEHLDEQRENKKKIKALEEQISRMKYKEDELDFLKGEMIKFKKEINRKLQSYSKKE